MQIHYTCPYWGQEGTRAPAFIARALQDGYDGVEINLPESDDFVREFLKTLESVRSSGSVFKFIAQQVISPASESADNYIRRMTARLEFLTSLKPDFINSHTGKDYFSFEDNCRAIEAAENIAHRTGIPILHETHRGRFTFHTASLIPYLKKYSALRLTGDFSHWCAVSESMLDDQAEILKQIIPHIHHIHARIGYEHGPQVNDPFAPEWNGHKQVFLHWWKQILAVQRVNGRSMFTITPEAGPAPYMPTRPYSQEPLSDQWKVNNDMKMWLSSELK